MRLALVFALLSGPVLAHDAIPTADMPMGWKYSPTCCHGSTVGGDCQAIPGYTVKAILGGYRITLRRGDHRLVTTLHVYEIEQAKVLESPDGRYHACLYPTEAKLQCFYGPPMAF